VPKAGLKPSSSIKSYRVIEELAKVWNNEKNQYLTSSLQIHSYLVFAALKSLESHLRVLNIQGFSYPDIRPYCTFVTMSFKVTVMYPNKPDTKFNTKYYLDYHMPLVERVWKPFGLLKWELIQAVPGLDGNEGNLYMYNVLSWRDQEGYIAASAVPDTTKIWDDLPNVCNHPPSVVMGDRVASG
jgi:uncharacterized protein (TIGR02118 family)